MKLRLFVDRAEYGSQLFFVYYLIDESNKLVDAKWSKQLHIDDEIKNVSQ